MLVRVICRARRPQLDVHAAGARCALAAEWSGGYVVRRERSDDSPVRSLRLWHMNTVEQLNTSLAGRYEVEREIGAGGMATVYLAHDVRHHRRVALKLLKPELGAILGAERFLSEIRVTANLQHPNLLPLFDSGEADGLLFYVMPYVEGESLRQRIDRDKQLPIEDAVRISTAIAGALDYAHRHGVIHRDLKPENVLLHDGQPLVADFGIALAVSNAGGQRVTQTGLSLGTPQYMSPEQATGDRNVDGRTDIYSLGAVTYEMLVGEPPHLGTTAQAIIARLMTEEPRPLTTSRRSVPDHVEGAVLHALEKLPADRFQTAKDFADALQGHGAALPTGIRTRSGAAVETRANRMRRRRSIAAVALAFAAIGAGIAYRMRPAAVAFPTARFEFDAPPGILPVTYGSSIAFSPDGRLIVFSGEGRKTQLYSRSVGELQAKPIPGTENGVQPMFSPDGRWIAFLTETGMKKVAVTGGAAVAVAPGNNSGNGSDWTRDGVIVLGENRPFHGLLRIPEGGGTPAEFTKPDSTHGVRDHVFPVVLEDGKTIVFALYDGKSNQESRLAMTSLDNGEVHPLDVAGIAPLGVVESYLVYVTAEGAIMAAPFDVRGRKVTGSPITVLDSVYVCSTCNGDHAARVSRSGSLVALRGSSETRLVVVDRNGGEHALSQQGQNFTDPRFSPDGRRLAVSVSGTDSAHNRDIWIYDVATGSPTRLTSGRDNYSPRWTADGNRIVFTAGDHRNPRQVWEQAADGNSPPKRIDDAPQGAVAEMSPDGRSIVFSMGDGNVPEVRAVTTGSGAKPTVFANDKGAGAPTFSPDGRWVAYSSTESGRAEIYVRPFPGPGGRVQVSINGGHTARWINGGRALTYMNSKDELEVATVTTTPVFAVESRAAYFGSPTKVLEQSRGHDVSPDAQRVAVVKPSERGMKVLVVLNWVQELRDRLKRP
jgi:Tol biopolymer transport system component/tRNA A-37 threonylcarbamoyl transferase component Bud32